MKKKLIVLVIILQSCGTRLDEHNFLCAGASNPQTEYVTGIHYISQFMPPIALILTPLALLQSEKDRNVRKKYSELVTSKITKNLINTLESNKSGQITIWEDKKYCTVKAIKPIETLKIRNRDCRKLEWFHYKYSQHLKGNASTGYSTYCREKDAKIWNQESETVQCNSDYDRILGNSCISDKTYNFPFPLLNPYANAYQNALGYFEYIPMNDLESK